jgi:hypothetical protein
MFPALVARSSRHARDAHERLGEKRDPSRWHRPVLERRLRVGRGTVHPEPHLGPSHPSPVPVVCARGGGNRHRRAPARSGPGGLLPSQQPRRAAGGMDRRGVRDSYQRRGPLLPSRRTEVLHRSSKGGTSGTSSRLARSVSCSAGTWRLPTSISPRSAASPRGWHSWCPPADSFSSGAMSPRRKELRSPRTRPGLACIRSALGATT